ncbi:MAG: ATP-binding protein [Vicingaceae bacterium]|nr:ATP-binding protein [Vicingaceae bacterium]
MKTFIPSDLQHRLNYLNLTLPFIGKNVIKVFTGQRRVGKSYLLFQLIEYIQKKDEKTTIIYINKEDLSYAFIKNAQDLSNYIATNKKGKTSIFIDEIQEIADFEDALRSLLLDKSLDIYCTGSNANLLSKDVAGKLSGRCIEIKVYSLSYLEFLDFHQLENTNESLEKYLKFGGLPYLKNLALEPHIVFEYLKNIYSTIVYRDIVNRYSLRNTTFLEQLILFLASNTGSIFSAKKISDFLKSQQIKVAPNQVQTYISHIVDAFILHKVSRYDIIGKRIFEVGEKYYFENLGIRHGIWGYRPEDKGKIIENAVYNHLLFNGYTVTVGIMDNLEIDFVAQKNNEKQYFQVALSINDTKTMEREFGNLKKIKDNYPKTVIALDAFNGNTNDGIKNCDLKTFLSENI